MLMTIAVGALAGIFVHLIDPKMPLPRKLGASVALVVLLGLVRVEAQRDAVETASMAAAKVAVMAGVRVE